MEWDDIVSSSEWSEAKQVEEWRDFDFSHTCQTVGWLLTEAKTYVIVAACRTVDDKHLNLVQRIPRGCVKRIWEVKNEDDSGV